MTVLRVAKTSFASGEIGPAMLGRVDLRAFENGARRLRNVVVEPSGAVRRRPGLAYVAGLPARARLIAFEFNTEQAYLLALLAGEMRVFRDGVQVAAFATPWTDAQLDQVVWTQSADTLLVVHPEVEPRNITRTSHTAWTVEPWSFFEEKGIRYQPYHKFAADAVTLKPSATTGTVTLAASADVFVAGHVGLRFRVQQKELTISAVTGPRNATGTLVSGQTIPDSSATADWEEAAFSVIRGWPCSVTFHQDRLVIGGSRDLPNRLWLSKSGDLFNFDLGTGLDDEAIEFTLLSDQVNAIRHVFSGRHLQVFTSGAEWMVSGEPLTPENVQLDRQTRIGSPAARSVRPRDVDGATLFVGRGGHDLREFLFADGEQAYQATDLALLAPHLVQDPVAIDYDPDDRLLHVVNADGSLATLTVYRAEQVTAWALQTTQGAFRSVAVASDQSYVAVERDGAWSIERFDRTFSTDAALRLAPAAGAGEWTGLSHLDGKACAFVGGGVPLGTFVPASGAVAATVPSVEVEAGLPFLAEIEPLPPTPAATGGATPRSLRLIEASFRLLDSRQMRVDTGAGPIDVPFRSFNAATAFGNAVAAFTGEKRVRALGWRRAGVDALWRIELPSPLPFTLLSVTQEMKVND
ncbi:MAG: hypothetical protein GC202_01260 [Alphaproteobacteria bacterium]|nr:hypothetical protein [Alphaproteobacteria bacterium]